MSLRDTAPDAPCRTGASFAPLLCLWSVGAFASACGDDATPPNDAGGVDVTAGEPAADGGRDGAHEAEVEADSDLDVVDGDPFDGGTPFSGEKLAFVATEVTLSAERLCDLDGDGVADNAIAELGAPGSDNAVMLWNALGEAARDDGYGPGLYFPVVADGGESLLIALAGDGTGLGGALSAPYESMDGCGEPLYTYSGPLVDGGRFHLESAEYPILLSDAVATGGASLTGTIEPGAERLSIVTEECLAPTIRSLGATLGPTQTRGRSLLEILLAGGAQLGMPSVPGLSPDLDLDGDGLERVLLDDEGLVLECVDGDSTVIVGTDCWADDRMADAFSLTLRARYEETTFAGRLDDWLTHCDDGYPRPSLFGEEWNVARDWQLAVGDYHSCLLDPEGVVRCWGNGVMGQLGNVSTEIIGDDEPACEAGPVLLGEGALSIVAAEDMTCSILSGRRVKCWGYDYINDEMIGDDEPPAAAADVSLGAPAQQFVTGWYHLCALLSGGRVRCWGSSDRGQLGTGTTVAVAAEDAPLAPDTPVGGRAVDLAAAREHTCALLEGGDVRCWGKGDEGRLGYGNEEDVGDDEVPADLPPVALGGPAVAIDVGEEHSCAILETGQVRCWGLAWDGRLASLSDEPIGDDEAPADVPPVDVGGTAVAITAGGRHTCVLLDHGGVRCWGSGYYGVLGYLSEEDVGDDEVPADMGDVQVGGPVVAIAAGLDHTCALLEAGAVRCWGAGWDGQLGYGLTTGNWDAREWDMIGDDETPAEVGDVPVVCDP